MIIVMGMKMKPSRAAKCGLLFFFIVVPVRAFAQPAFVGHIAATAGDVSIVRHGAYVVPETGAPVYRDDTITTGSTGRMRILFADNTAISIGPNTGINIDRYVSTPSKRDVLLSMIRGRARFFVSKITNILNTYDIHTATAIIGIRGTDFLIDVSNKRETAVYVIDGSIGLRNIKQGAANPVVVNTGMMSIVRADQPPSLPEQYAPAVLQHLLGGITLQSNNDIINQPVPYDIAMASLAKLTAMMAKNKPAGALALEEQPVEKTELPSQKVLRTYKESVSPVLPFEE
jgi:hypothetical protein